MTSELDRRLSYLGFQLIEPPSALRPYVQSFWVVRRDQPLAGSREEFMHPGGGFGMVFNLGDALRFNGQPLAHRIFLDGINTVSHRMGFEGDVRALGIRFHPGAAFHFLGIPLHELANQMLPLDALDGMSTTIVDQLYESASLAEKFETIENWLLGRFAEARHAGIVPASLGLLQSQRGHASMKRLAESLHIGQRQLERLYQTYVGMTPKQYARLLRVGHAREALKVPETGSTAELGAMLGYYDQSHFIREFKSVVGMTPIAYMQRARRMQQGQA